MKRMMLLFCVLLIFCPHAFSEELSAECACVLSAETGEVLFSKNAEKEHAMASTTKIMTALLAIESGRMDEVATISKNAERQEGSSLYLRSGEEILVSDLVYGLMLNSGNDAAVALAEHLDGNIGDFSSRMTQKAREIGAEHTQFQNPSGLDQDGHYTTALDLAKIAAYAMKNEAFCQVVSTKQKTITTASGQTIYLKNHNKLLDQYKGALGVKTGYTKKTGRCLVSAAKRDGILLIAVTLHAPNDWNDHKVMLDEAFSKLSLRRILSAGQLLKETQAEGCPVNLIASEEVTIPELRPGTIEIRLHTAEKLLPPLNRGEKAGEAEIFRNGVLVRTVDLLCEQSIPMNNEKIYHKILFSVLKRLIL